VIVAKLPPLELHSGAAGIDFPDPLRKAGREDFYFNYKELALAELEPLTGALLSVFLALLDARITRQQAIGL
jgi:hypothetical protein